MGFKPNANKDAKQQKAAETGAKVAAGGIGAALATTIDLATDVADLAREALTGKPTKDTRQEMFQKICAIIPNQINNKTVVSVLDMLRKEQKLLRQNFEHHLESNRTSFLNHEEAIRKSHGYVEDQNAWTDVAYGAATMQYSGCEIFATYNAIFNIKGRHPMSLPDMIHQYEKDGMVLSGKFGTAPKAIRDFLEKQGFETVLTTKEEEFDKVIEMSKTLIMTMYNNKDDISKEVHTVNISKENGKLTAHNVYCNGSVVGPYDTMEELMAHTNGGKAKIISLIGIVRENEES